MTARVDSEGTIAALASAPGPAARGIVRISGPRTLSIVEAVFRGEASGAPDVAQRGLFVGRFDDGVGEQPALLLWMPGPRSFTREDVAELHLPGSPPLLAVALERVLALGARPAARGEFTRRAFLGGRIDLTRAEGVLSLVSASTRVEVRAARALLFGGLAERVEALRARLTTLRALIEASLDFDQSETGHVPEDEVRAAADEVLAGLGAALEWEVRRAPSMGEPRLVLCGAPNAGKSQLFNALSAERALVSEHASTTRDSLGTTLEIGGLPCRLFDTPGFDDGALGADAEAQEIARSIRASADVCLWVVDAATADPRVLKDERALLPTAPRLLIWNKLDLEGVPREPPVLLRGESWVGTAGRTALGLTRLVEAVAGLLGHGSGAIQGGQGAGSEGIVRELSARHRKALEAALAEVRVGREAWELGGPLDLLAEALRAATSELDGVTGSTTSEDVLDEIFSRFCLGK